MTPAKRVHTSELPSSIIVCMERADGTYRSGAYKVSNEMIQEIRRLYKTGKYTYSELAMQFKIGKSHVGNMIGPKLANTIVRTFLE